MEEDPLKTITPDFSRKFANLHYMSEITQEYGTIVIRPTTTEDDIMDQYVKKFPRECNFYLQTIADCNKMLYKTNGMSKEGIMMSLTKLPEILYTAMKYLNEDYWANKKNFYRFIRRYPKFMIGDKREKTTHRGNIIK